MDSLATSTSLGGPAATLVSRPLHTPDLNANLRHQKRDIEYILQPNARPELKVVSQPPRANLDALRGFGYDIRAGEGISVYIIEFGVNKYHPVSAFSKD
jgi:hypothetical protein